MQTRWWRGPGSNLYGAFPRHRSCAHLTSAGIASAQREGFERVLSLVAWESKRWPELPVARKRVVLIALIERIEVSVDRIDIRFRPSRLSALLGAAATPLQGATDDETEILSVPVRLRRAGREIRMVITAPIPLPRNLTRN